MVAQAYLLNGMTKSCGCLRREVAGNAQRTHSQSQTSTYNIRKQIFQRCHNPANSKYKDYGARGITVCERWRDSFEAFIADIGQRPPGLSIERIDNNGNYEPGNVRVGDAKRASQQPEARESNAQDPSFVFRCGL